MHHSTVVFTITNLSNFLFLLASGQPEALNELISHGATLSVVEKNGATPLHLAAQVSAPISGQLLSFLVIFLI